VGNVVSCTPSKHSACQTRRGPTGDVNACNVDILPQNTGVRGPHRIGLDDPGYPGLPSAHMKPTLTSLILGLTSIALALALSACMDGPHAVHQGGPGAPCDAHEACLSPLLCLDVPDVTFPVCTGNGLQGEACSAESACAWLRDSRGLPLTCLEGVCQFPADGDAP
jgi:hypothetical protein